MGWGRAGAALVLAALLGAGAWWIWENRPTGGSGVAGAHEVTVVAPDGSTFWSGAVVLGDGATALGALQEAARLGNFTVELEPGPYVVGIGPYHESATLGWTFWVDSGDGWWCPPVGAAEWRLDPGERVAWRWAVPGGDC